MNETDNAARWQALRKQVLIEEGLCRLCLVMGVRRDATCVDHVLPLSLGGKAYDRANLQGLCFTCQDAKNQAEELLLAKRRGGH